VDEGLRLRIRRIRREVAQQHAALRPLYRSLWESVEIPAPEPPREAFRLYRRAIEAHFALEERLFFPALHGLHPERSREIDQLAREHVALRGDLDGLGGKVGDGAAARPLRAALEGFAQSLARHEEREEGLLAGVEA
jgi:hypothetical protein